MSAENAKEFIKRAFTDKLFGEQLLNFQTEEERQKFITDSGYTFTEEEMQKLLPDHITVQDLKDFPGKSELPDETMEAIVGGKSMKEAGAILWGIDIAVYVSICASN